MRGNCVTLPHPDVTKYRHASELSNLGAHHMRSAGAQRNTGNHWIRYLVSFTTNVCRRGFFIRVSKGQFSSRWSKMHI